MAALARPSRAQLGLTLSAITILPVRMSFVMSIAENIAQVRERIAAAARRAARASDEITLMAVSKTFPAEQMHEAYSAGLRVFGENRVQEFAGKADALRDLRDVEWHLIGHLQSNKAEKATELFDAVDSVDSMRLAEKLNASAESAGKILSVLIEIRSEERRVGKEWRSRWS